MTQRPLSLAVQDLARYIAQFRDSLPMFVVTEKPIDYPEYFVARLHLTQPREPLPVTIMDRDIERIRRIMEALGLVRITRSPEDDPVIVETWL